MVPNCSLDELGSPKPKLEVLLATYREEERSYYVMQPNHSFRKI